MADSTQLEQQAVERLSEDESLRGRGELTDFGFEPLLNWGIAAVTAYAQRAADEAQMDAYTNRVREVIRAAVAAAEAGKLDDAAALTDFEPGHKAALQAKLAALTLSDDPDANGEQIAGVLQEAVSVQPAAGGKDLTVDSKQPEEAVSRQPSAFRPETAQTATESVPAEPKTEAAIPTPEKKSDAPVLENENVPLELQSEPKVEVVATAPSDFECRLGAANLRRKCDLHSDLGGTATDFENPPPEEAKNAPDADAEDNNATALGNAVAGQLNKAFAGIRSLFNRKDTGENQDEQEEAHHHQPQPEK